MMFHNTLNFHFNNVQNNWKTMPQNWKNHLILEDALKKILDKILNQLNSSAY